MSKICVHPSRINVCHTGIDWFCWKETDFQNVTENMLWLCMNTIFKQTELHCEFMLI